MDWYLACEGGECRAALKSPDPQSNTKSTSGLDWHQMPIPSSSQIQVVLMLRPPTHSFDCGLRIDVTPLCLDKNRIINWLVPDAQHTRSLHPTAVVLGTVLSLQNQNICPDSCRIKITLQLPPAASWRRTFKGLLALGTIGPPCTCSGLAEVVLLRGSEDLDSRHVQLSHDVIDPVLEVRCGLACSQR